MVSPASGAESFDGSVDFGESDSQLRQRVEQNGPDKTDSSQRQLIEGDG